MDDDTPGGARPPRAAPGRGRRSDGERSYQAIMEVAPGLATERGLDGMSISDLAAATSMSKAGLYAHFGTKEELQLAIIDAAARIMDARVTEPALRLQEPIARLRALCENFLDYAQHTFPGGCFFAAASSEFDTRAGAVRDRIAEQHTAWMKLLADTVEAAVQAGQLDTRGKDPAQLAFELASPMHQANDSYVLHQDPQQIQHARTAITWLLEQHTPHH
jgi:AcrR family transcriptional regulator